MTEGIFEMKKIELGNSTIDSHFNENVRKEKVEIITKRFYGENETFKKVIHYKNDEKTIDEIDFCNTNNKIIDTVDGSKLQELLKDLNDKYDIETLTMSINEKDSSIKHYSTCNKIDKNIRYVISYKDNEKIRQIIDENNELQNTLLSVQNTSNELTDKEKDDLLPSSTL